MNIYEIKQLRKIFLLVSAFIIGAGSLIYTNRLVDTIEEDERKKIELWAEATRILVNTESNDSNINFPLEVLENNTQIPVIVTNSSDSILFYRNLDTTRVYQHESLRKKLAQMKNENYSILIDIGNKRFQYLYYHNSSLYHLD